MLRRLMLLFIILSLGISACGGGDDEDQEPKSNNQNIEVPDVTPTFPFEVDLVVWHPYDDQRAMALSEAVEDFNAAYEDVASVSLEYHDPGTIRSDYEDALRSGEGPDILVAEQQWIGEFVDANLIYPIQASVEDIIQTDFPVTVFQSFFYHDQMWAIPLWADLLVLYTNNSLVEESPSTLDDLITASENQNFILYPAAEGTIGLYGNRLPFIVDLDGNTVFNKLNMIDYLDLYRRLVSVEGIIFAEDTTAFENGDAGGLVAFVSDYERLQETLGDNLQVSRLPNNNQIEWQMFSYLTPLILSPNAPDTSISAANLFFSYLLTPTVQLQLAETAQLLPLVAPSNAELSEITSIGLGQLSWSQSRSSYPEFYETVMPELDAMLEKVTVSTTDEEFETLMNDFFTNIE